MHHLATLTLIGLFGVAHGWLVPSVSSRLSKTALYNNNVVLRPSEDPEAFDSHNIGSARVHRYVRDNDEAEYVMWYHGRPKDFDVNKELPPLTTGRIGRATSLNGLAWEKCVEGSVSEDVEGVSLGLNKDSWWAFDTAHVGLGQVLLPMTTPAVIAEGGVYLMYYMGGSFEEKPIADYLENVESDETIKGMKMKIGVAVSQDGKTFGRVEGDDPSGACVAPYDTSDPNMKHVATNSPHEIEEELYCGWPEVAVHGDLDVEVTPGGEKQQGFIMYYSTMRKSDKQKCLGYAVSADGFRWFKRGICLEPDEDGLDAGGCARCAVMQNAEYDEETSTWESSKGWTMYYEGVSKEDNKHRVMMAESVDGVKWEKRGMILDVGESDEAWDHMGVGSPHVVRLDDGSLRMYYTGQGPDGSTAIGVAKFHSDDGTWAREQAEFSFAA